MGLTLPSSTLPERLRARVDVERAAARAGQSFRRRPNWLKAEDLFVKPAIRLGLRATSLYGRGMRNALDVRLTHRTLAFPDLPREFDGFRLLHLSDLHIDALPGLADVVARKLAGIYADVCVMTGDYRCETHGPCDAALDGMEKVIAALPDCPIIGTLGNHDPSEIAGGLENLGVQLLINESVEMWRGCVSLSFAGTDDSYDYRTDDLAAALDGIPNASFKILLAHSPDLYAEAASAGVRLYLCGHTHAGQVRLPLIGSVIQNCEAPRRYTHGLWQHQGMQGFTSSGVGCSMVPVRFNCPPEIVVFELTRRIGHIQSARSRPRLLVVPAALPTQLPV